MRTSVRVPRIARLVCDLKGHDWVARDEIVYEQAKMMAYVGGVRQEVDGTMVSDEICARCGRKFVLPTTATKIEVRKDETDLGSEYVAFTIWHRGDPSATSERATTEEVKSWEHPVG